MRISSSWSVRRGRVVRLVSLSERKAALRAYWRQLKQDKERRAG